MIFFLWHRNTLAYSQFPFYGYILKCNFFENVVSAESERKFSSSRANDRRHLSELNQEKNFTSSLNREQRLNSVERENNKLVSPEKVLSLRRNSSAAGADFNSHTSQPLSSLFSPANADDEAISPAIARTGSKNARDFSSLESSKRYVSESFQKERSNHLVNSFQELRSNSTSNHVESKRAVIDSASNVKGSRRLFLSNLI